MLRGPVNKTRLVGQMWKRKTIQKPCPFSHTCLCLMGYLWPLLPYALNVYTIHCLLASKMLFWHVQQSWLYNSADCGWVSSDFKAVRDGTVRLRRELFFLPASLVEADLFPPELSRLTSQRIFPAVTIKRYLHLWRREQLRASTCAMWMCVQIPGETKDWQSIKRKVEARFLHFFLIGHPHVFSLCVLSSWLSGSGNFFGLALKPRKLIGKRFMHLGAKGKKRWTQVRTSFTTIRFKVRPPRGKASVSHSDLPAALCLELNLIPHVSRTVMGAKHDCFYHCFILGSSQTSMLGPWVFHAQVFI